MKFLCVDCDEGMSLVETKMHEEISSLSVVYSCPKCGRRMAMLTNPVETQLVTSLGVKIGPQNPIVGELEKAAGASMSKCPFASMISKMEEATGVSASVVTTPTASEGAAILWSEAAADRLNRIPEFVRTMAKSGIENFARERGYRKIDEQVLDEARVAIGV
jgi:hypothetical protein